MGLRDRCEGFQWFELLAGCFDCLQAFLCLSIYFYIYIYIYIYIHVYLNIFIYIYTFEFAEGVDGLRGFCYKASAPERIGVFLRAHWSLC